MKFTAPWAFLEPPEEGGVLTPVLAVFVRKRTGRKMRRQFIVDSGADISVAPRELCELAGLTWSAGVETQLRGISAREECVVAARMHDITVLVVEARKELLLPVCFAEDDAPLLLGREGFFDAFLVEFDKSRSITTFKY